MAVSIVECGELELDKADGSGRMKCTTGELFSGSIPNIGTFITVDGDCCNAHLFRVEAIPLPS
jgi:hypothetical protein